MKQKISMLKTILEKASTFNDFYQLGKGDGDLAAAMVGLLKVSIPLSIALDLAVSSTSFDDNEIEINKLKEKAALDYFLKTNNISLEEFYKIIYDNKPVVIKQCETYVNTNICKHESNIVNPSDNSTQNKSKTTITPKTNSQKKVSTSDDENKPNPVVDGLNTINSELEKINAAQKAKNDKLMEQIKQQNVTNTNKTNNESCKNGKCHKCGHCLKKATAAAHYALYCPLCDGEH